MCWTYLHELILQKSSLKPLVQHNPRYSSTKAKKNEAVSGWTKWRGAACAFEAIKAVPFSSSLSSIHRCCTPPIDRPSIRMLKPTIHTCASDGTLVARCDILGVLKLAGTATDSTDLLVHARSKLTNLTSTSLKLAKPQWKTTIVTRETHLGYPHG